MLFVFIEFSSDQVRQREEMTDQLRLTLLLLLISLLSLSAEGGRNKRDVSLLSNGELRSNRNKRAAYTTDPDRQET